MLLSEKLMGCCAVDRNKCLDLRCRATALDGWVSAEWSRCPGSMARCPRDNVAPVWRSSAGWMLVRIGSLSAGVGRRHPVTRHRWWWGQWGGYEHCDTKQERSTRHSNGPVLGWMFATLLLQHPNQSQQAASGVWRVMLASCEAVQDVGGTWAGCSRNVTPRCFGSEQKDRVLLLKLTFSSCLASLLLRWKTADTVFVVLSFSFQVWRYSPSVAIRCSAPLPPPANLHQHAWLLSRQHMHTFWRWWLAGKRCRCWIVWVPEQIPVGLCSWGVVTCSFCHFWW